MLKEYCVQCNEEIQAITEDEKYSVCMRPECPNYGLLQLGNEHLKSFKEQE